MTELKITYKINVPLNIDTIIEIYNNSGLHRPTQDKQRITKMFQHSNLVVSAWMENTLVGIARSLTDFSFCCYLSDLAVKKEFQKKGIGKELIRITKEHVGEHSMLLLLSVPTAMEYYSKIGMQKTENGFIINRTK